MARKKLETAKDWLESVDEHVLSNNNDRVAAVVGDEGAGKSTFMLHMAVLWDSLHNDTVDNERVLENILWGGRDEFVKALRERDPGSLIAVQDAAHSLYSKEAMHGSQIQLEKSLLDIRIRNFLIVLGFQDFDDMPRGLKRRRCETVFYLETHRGQPTGNVKIFDRESIDERVAEDEWPDADAQDQFGPLDGTDIWQSFSERDKDAKLSRLEGSQDMDPDEMQKREQLKIALRAVRPWNEAGGMSQAQTARALLDYSQSWLSEQIRSWKSGEYPELLPDKQAEVSAEPDFGGLGSPDGTNSETEAD